MLEPLVAPDGIKRSFAVSVLLHTAGLAVLVSLGEARRDAAVERELAFRAREATPLVAPPMPSEIRLEDLLEKPRVFLPPAAKPPRPPVSPAPAVPPPKLELPGTAPVAPPPTVLGFGQSATPPPPAPKIETDQPPRLAFETPAGATPASPPGGPPAGPLIRRPSSSLEDAMREVARSRGGGIVVGDLDAGPSLGDVSEMRGVSPAFGRPASNLELLSDPQGVDFRPYLTRILATVRRNWTAVMPESARLGRRGKVVIQLSIDRGGGIPKLVIAESSGAEPLDRAAVAGITASHPFPPLPDAFPGDEIRLQFNFLYNMR